MPDSPLGPLDPALRGITVDRPLTPTGGHGARVHPGHGHSLAPDDSGATRPAVTPVSPDLSADYLRAAPIAGRVDHPLSQLPTTLAGMEDAFQRLKTREIDTSAIAAIVHEVRHYGARAHAACAPVPVADNAELMTLAGRRLDDYHAALGLHLYDIAALHAASRSAGHWYPSASVPINLLQYAVPALLGATGNPCWAVGIARMSAGFSC